MKINCVWEHNGADTILYADNFIGAFARGASRDEALLKIENEVRSWLIWKNEPLPEELTAEIVQEYECGLQVRDADSDVLFDSERPMLSGEEYDGLKELALKSALDFYRLYSSVPDKGRSVLPARETFYGGVPRTAEEMYVHTKGVNPYYFGEIGVEADSDGTIYECRKRGFELLEKQPDYLDNQVFCGSYGEYWSLRKVIRRFVWHDRIHAKAMYRMALRTFGPGAVGDIFKFGIHLIKN